MNEPAGAQQLSTRLFALLRTLQLAMIVMCLFLATMGEILQGKATAANVGQMVAIIGALALFEVLATVYVRRVKISQTESVLRINSEDGIGLLEARKWYVVAFAFCAGIAMYGFTLRAMSASLMQAGTFYAVAIGLLLYCTPRKPE